MLSVDFSEILQVRREWDDRFKVLKERNCQPKILYPAKLSFRNEGEIKAEGIHHLLTCLTRDAKRIFSSCNVKT